MGLITALNAEHAETAERTLLLETVHDAPQAVLDEPLDVEIEKQADLTSGESQIREKLRRVNTFEAFDGLDLHDYRVLHKKIDAETAIETLPFVHDRKRLLSLDTESTGEQFECQTCFVGVFEKARAKLVMNGDCAGDYGLGDLIEWTRHAPRRMQDSCLALPSRFCRFPALREQKVAVSSFCGFCVFCVCLSIRISRNVPTYAL